MALKKCAECGTEISTKARACPKCGAPRKAGISIVRILVGVVVALVLIPTAVVALGALTSNRVQDIENQVASQAIQQYEMVKRGGDQMQTCAQAGLVVAAFIQAKDEGNYTRWKDIEKSDCARAGLQKP